MKSLASCELAAFAKEKGLSPAGVAKLVGANRSQVYRLLTGERGPSNPLAVRIEQVTSGRVKAADWTVPVSKRPAAKGRRPMPRSVRSAAARVVRHEGSIPHNES